MHPPSPGLLLRASRLARAVLVVGLGGLTATSVASVAGVPTDPTGRLPSASAATVPASSPTVLASWRFDESSGGVAHDRTGVHPATITRGVRVGQVAQGPTATSFGFNGTGQVRAPAAGLDPGLQALSAWFRLPRGASAHFGRLIDTGGVVVDAGRRLRVGTCAALGPCAWRSLPALVTDGAWHQVAFSQRGGTATWWLDGRPAATVAGTSTGRSPSSGQVSIGSGFRGNLDDVVLYGGPLADSTVVAAFRAGACPQLTARAPTNTTAVAPLPALPLHTSGRYVVDRAGHRVKLAAVNWYGAEELDGAPAGLQCQSADVIAARITAAGFNVVRLPWATNTWLGRAPLVPPVAVAADPTLRGLNARQVFDAVVDRLAAHGLLVILDNHVTRAGWCCSNVDGNALWWQGYRPSASPRWQRLSRDQRLHYFRLRQARWLRAWSRIAGRYGAAGSHPQRAVVGADLRNEPRPDRLLGIAAHWAAGRQPPWTDWARAATRGGDRVLRANPRLLIVVEGVDYATDLRGAAVAPIRLSHSRRLVYSAHDYAWSQSATTAGELRRQLGARWGWLLHRHRWYTTPVWVGEFGTWHPEEASSTPADRVWFAAFTRYLADGDLDWAYWSFNGTAARGRVEPTTCAETPRFPGCGEGYGLSDATWGHMSSARLTSTLHALQNATQGP